MKKLVFLILIILPIFLMASISLAARVIIMMASVPVESVEFINENEDTITRVELRKGDEYQVLTRILPEKATNKKVTFSLSSGSDGICTLSSGVITAVGYGSCRLTVITEEQISANLTIVVADRNVDEVTLDYSEKTIYEGDDFLLTAYVLPQTAQNRKVVWTSSDPTRVEVNRDSGRIRALDVTEENMPVVITATSVDGEKSADCLVTVLAAKMAFYRKGEVKPITLDKIIVSTASTIDLFDYLKFDEELIDPALIAFNVTVGIDYCSIDNNMLTFLRYDSAVTVTATVTLNSGETVTCSARFRQNSPLPSQ